MSQTQPVQESILSPQDVEQIQSQYERQFRLMAAAIQLQATSAEHQLAKKKLTGKGVPDFPPEPDWYQTMVSIPLKFVSESLNHLPDSAPIVKGLTSLISTPEGLALIGRIKAALFDKHYDPDLFKDFLSYLGQQTGDYGSLMLGVASEVSVVQGIAGVTGLAIPTKGSGPMKWFSGLERSKGAIVEAGAYLLVGRRKEEPQQLTDQFYGYYAGIDIGPSIGTSLYFTPDKDLNYKGFTTIVGVGAGGGAGTIWGWEMVTSD